MSSWPPGDIDWYWHDEQAAIAHGDCLEILPRLPKGCVDLVLTDPPYGIALENHDPVGGAGHGRRRAYTIRGDEDRTSAIRLIQIWNGSLIIFAPAGKPWPGKWSQWLIWDKGNQVGTGGEPTMYWKNSFEIVQVRNLGKLNPPREPAVLRFPVLSGSDFQYHPTQKPVALLAYLIRKVSHAIILDPFMGSGTTLVAAKELGRRAIGIEIEEKYCRIAVERLQQGVLPLTISE